jgi:hypothetical protein
MLKISMSKSETQTHHAHDGGQQRHEDAGDGAGKGAAANHLRQRSRGRPPGDENARHEEQHAQRRIAKRDEVDDDRAIVEHRQYSNERQRHAGSTRLQSGIDDDTARGARSSFVPAVGNNFK